MWLSVDINWVKCSGVHLPDENVGMKRREVRIVVMLRVAKLVLLQPSPIVNQPHVKRNPTQLLRWEQGKAADVFIVVSVETIMGIQASICFTLQHCRGHGPHEGCCSV